MSTHAGSGHPTSSLSAADIMAMLVSKYFTYDIEHPDNLHNDRLIFSKGHASPLYYALWASMGALDEADLLTYRQFNSVLEGHPTPRFKHTIAATGSLGMGLGIGAGVAYGLRNYQSHGSVYVLLGDGEMAEGSVWEAAAFASQHKLENLIAIVDINRLGQSGPTAYGHDCAVYVQRLRAFGWEVMEIDGHDFEQIERAYSTTGHHPEKPFAIVAKTIKGKGVSFLEDAEHWHGKALSLPEFERAVEEIGAPGPVHLALAKPSKTLLPAAAVQSFSFNNANDDDLISVRRALGDALQEIAQQDDSIVVLDGDVQNSTFTEMVHQYQPDQFLECYIAEQLIVSVATGLSVIGYRPVVATFAAFLTRGYDQIRMAAVSNAHIILIGTHVGVSIGQDGPSQMGLEDMAMMRAVHDSIVLSPSDAVSAVALLSLTMVEQGIRYIRATRADTPILYSAETQFGIGKSATLRSSPQDRVVIVATGICVHEALRAYDLLKKEGILVRVIDMYSIKPIDIAILHHVASITSHIITVEDHWSEGGLGDAVLDAFSGFHGLIPHITKLAIRDMPRSGEPDQLLDAYGISAQHIVSAVQIALKE